MLVAQAHPMMINHLTSKWVGELGNVGCVFIACSLPLVHLILRGHFFSTLVLFIFPVKLELLLLTRVCYTADCNVFTLLRSLLLELETWDNSHSHDKFPNQGNIKMKAETTPSHTFPGLCHGVGEQLHIWYCYCSRPASYKC